MFTNNFYKVYVPTRFCGEQVPRSFVVCIDDAFSAYTYNNSVVVDTLGNLLKTQITKFEICSTSYSPRGFAFGSGNTPPTIDDYKLSGDYINPSDYQVTTTVTVNTETEYTTEYTATYSITNISSNDITIGEVALCGYLLGRATSNGTNKHCSFIIDRTVLDTPVTIPAGGIGQVTYTIRMNYPTV